MDTHKKTASYDAGCYLSLSVIQNVTQSLELLALTTFFTAVTRLASSRVSTITFRTAASIVSITNHHQWTKLIVC